MKITFFKIHEKRLQPITFFFIHADPTSHMNIKICRNKNLLQKVTMSFKSYIFPPLFINDPESPLKFHCFLLHDIFFPTIFVTIKLWNYFSGNKKVVTTSCLERKFLLAWQQIERDFRRILCKMLPLNISLIIIGLKSVGLSWNRTIKWELKNILKLNKNDHVSILLFLLTCTLKLTLLMFLLFCNYFHNSMQFFIKISVLANYRNI